MIHHMQISNESDHKTSCFQLFFTALRWYQTSTKPRKTCEILNSVGMLFEVSNNVRTTSERRPNDVSNDVKGHQNPDPSPSTSASTGIPFIFSSCSSHFPLMFLSLSCHVPLIFLSCSFHYLFIFLSFSSHYPLIILPISFQFPFICFLPLLPHRFSIQETL